MNYNWCFDIIDKSKVKCVFELGARDCLDSVTLYEYFNCPIFTFECNPDCIKECLNTLQKNHTYPITLINKAVHEQNGIISFRPFNKEKYDNIGSSSIFEIDFITNRPVYDADYGKQNVQDIIEVEAIRLDSFIEKQLVIPDLICMDIQEAELIALKGLGDKLKYVKYIVFEASSKNTYKGGCSFFDVHNYLTLNNFRFVKSNNGSNFPEPTEYFSFFDCIYVNNSYNN
jgi:FkbM family methyltransferase